MPKQRMTWFMYVALLSAWLIACGDSSDSGREVGVTSAALSACNETVPENRFIDGVPAYAQCDATKSSAIYSNNGVDTATKAMGTDWIRTQYSGGYQCTELAHRYLYFKWQVKWIPNGNAGSWCDTMPPANSGVTQTMAPAHGDIMVLAPGSCGADATTGHVTVVDTVDTAKARLSVVEQNGARRGQYMQSCAKCFLHVVANDGTNPGADIAAPPVVGVAGAPATVPAAGTAAPAAGTAAPPAKRPPPPAAGTNSGTAGMPVANAGRASSEAGSSAPMMPVQVAGTGAAAGAPASTPSPTAPSQPSESGCSVGHAGSSAQALWFVLAWSMLARRRGRRS